MFSSKSSIFRAAIFVGCLLIAAVQCSYAQSPVLLLAQADATIRNQRTLYVTSGIGNGKNVARWAELHRANMIVRNPVGSPGNVVLTSKAASENRTIDTNSGTGLQSIFTLAPGEEGVFTDYLQIVMAQSDQVAGSVPAGLYVTVDVTIPENYVAAGAPAFFKRTATATRPRYKFQNPVAYATAEIVKLLDDGVWWVGRNPANRNQLRVSSNYLPIPSSATWTNLTTFAADGTSQIDFVIEMSNGEVLVCDTSTSSLRSRIFKSSGWAAAKASGWSSLPTWTQSTFDGNPYPTLGVFTRVYSGNQFANGSDGTVYMAESGAQTTSGSTTDGAIRNYKSADFGTTFTAVFNLRTYMTSLGLTTAAQQAGVHMHGVLYDQGIARALAIYGDNTGAGKNIAGANNTQLAFSTDSFTTFPAKVSAFPNWNDPATGSGQYISGMYNSRVTAFSPDTTIPLGTFVTRKSNGNTELIMPSVGADGGNKLMNYTGGFYCAPYSLIADLAAGTWPISFLISREMFNWDSVDVDVILAAPVNPGIYAVWISGTKVVLELTFNYNGVGSILVGDLVLQ